MRVQFLKTVGLLFNFLVVFEANQGVTLMEDNFPTTQQQTPLNEPQENES